VVVDPAAPVVVEDVGAVAARSSSPPPPQPQRRTALVARIAASDRVDLPAFSPMAV
jgi:hypothetical protein